MVLWRVLDLYKRDASRRGQAPAKPTHLNSDKKVNFGARAKRGVRLRLPWSLTRPRISPAFLDTESYLTLILRRESRQNKHFTGMAVAGITATFGTNATRWFANLIFAILCENQVRPDAPPQQKATPLTGVTFAVAEAEGFEPPWACTQTVFKTASL